MSLRVAKGYFTFKTKTLCAAGPITLNDAPETWAVEGAFGGLADQRLGFSAHQFTFNLDARLVLSLGVWSEILTKKLGSWLFDDTPMIFKFEDGEVRTYRNAAITGLGSVQFTSTGLAVVPVTITCLHGSGYNIGDADGLYVGTTASFSYPSISPADMLSEPYTASLGATAPWDEFELLRGFNFAMNVTTERKASERGATANFMLTGISATVNFIPDTPDIGPAEIEALMKGHGSAKMGQSVRSADDLVFTSDSLIITIKKPFVSAHTLSLDVNKIMEQGITMVATLGSTGGSVCSIVEV